MNRYFFALCALVAHSGWAETHTHHANHTASAAPVGVMGSHLHETGSLMVSYRYEHQRFEGVKDDSDYVSPMSVLATYGEVPTQMDMGMHMFEIMYGVSDDFTVMVMPHYMQMSMVHQSHGSHGAHEHQIEGVGDTEVSGLYSILARDDGAVKHRAHLNLGLSLPTGATDETFTNHHGVTLHLPYNMQLGSGTYDPILGATYTGESADWSWGAQTLNYIRVGRNDEGYRQGHKHTATAWLTRSLTDFAGLSVRLEGESWGDVSGRDATLPVTAIAGADPDEQAGERVLAYVGLNLFGVDEKGLLAGHHQLGAEFGVPVYERYDGPQAATDYRFTLGWQWMF